MVELGTYTKLADTIKAKKSADCRGIYSKSNPVSSMYLRGKTAQWLAIRRKFFFYFLGGGNAGIIMQGRYPYGLHILRCYKTQGYNEC